MYEPGITNRSGDVVVNRSKRFRPTVGKGTGKEASQKKGQQTDLGTKIFALPALSLARKCGLTCGTGGGVCCFSPLCSLCFKLMC